MEDCENITLLSIEPIADADKNMPPRSQPNPTPSPTTIAQFADVATGQLASDESSTVDRCPGVCGLKNLGNTCFMNSGLQCLLSLSPLACEMLELYSIRESVRMDDKSDKLVFRIAYLFAAVWSGQCQRLQPKSFRDLLANLHSQFNNFRQHDCQEFLALLLNTIHDELLYMKKNIHFNKLISCANEALDDTADLPDDFQSIKGLLNVQHNSEEEQLADELLEEPKQGLGMDWEPNETVVEASSTIGAGDNTEIEDPLRTSSTSVPTLKDLQDKDVKTKNVNVLMEEDDDDALLFEESGKFPSGSTVLGATGTGIGLPHIENYVHELANAKTDMKPNEINFAESLEKRFVDDDKCTMKSTKHLLENIPETEDANNAKRRKVEDKNIVSEARRKVNVKRNDMEVLEQSFSGAHTPPTASSESKVLGGSNSSFIPISSVASSSRQVSVPPRTCSTPDLGSLAIPSSSRDTPDLDLGEHIWRETVENNGTVITRNLQGLYQSTVVCNVCSKSVTTYEPFVYLSLSLPHAMERQLVVWFIPDPGQSSNRVCTKYLVTVFKNDSVKQLKEALSQVIGRSFQDFVVAEACGRRIVRVVEDGTSLIYLNDFNRKIYVFEISGLASATSADNTSTSANLHCSSSDIDVGGAMALRLKSLSVNDISSLGKATTEQSTESKFDLHLNNRLSNAVEGTPAKLGSAELAVNDLHPGALNNAHDFSSVNTQTSVQASTTSSSPMDNKAFASGRPSTNLEDCNMPQQAQSKGDEAAKESVCNEGTCRICLDERPANELLFHGPCRQSLCQHCLGECISHYGLANFNCPMCHERCNPNEDFLPPDQLCQFKPQTRNLLLHVVFRCDTRNELGNITKSDLVGHPAIVSVPNTISGGELYQMVNSLVPGISPHLANIVLVDLQGTRCSRCSPGHGSASSHGICHGCTVTTSSEILYLQSRDSLALVLKLPPTSAFCLQLSETTEHCSLESLRPNDPPTLYDCLEAFTNSEELDDSNPWYCPNCKKLRKARKTLTVWRYPDNLIICLKRFVFHKLSSYKVDAKVTFARTDLDLSPFISGPRNCQLAYDLQAVICHSGYINAGHYTSYTRNPLTDVWYHFNDDIVERRMPSDEDAYGAYILFYQRKGSGMLFEPPTSCKLSELDICQPTNTTGTQVSVSLAQQSSLTMDASVSSASNCYRVPVNAVQLSEALSALQSKLNDSSDDTEMPNGPDPVTDTPRNSIESSQISVSSRSFDEDFTSLYLN